MLRLIIILLIIAGVAGFFTKPEEPVMREAADAVLSDPQNISEGLESLGASMAGNRAYDNYFVASKYTVSLDGEPVVTCWGAFTQVSCSRAEEAAA